MNRRPVPILINADPRCSFCGKRKSQASLNVVAGTKSAICGFCVNQMAIATGRDALRMNAALWMFAFRYMRQAADGTWVPACDPDELAVAGVAASEFAHVLAALP